MIQRYRDNTDGSIVEAIQDTAANTEAIFDWVPSHRLRIVDMCGMPAFYLTTTGGGSERVWLSQWIVRRSEHEWYLFGPVTFLERFTAVEVQSAADIEDLFAEFANLSVKFWVCPDHEDGRVAWTGGEARCLTCGRTNSQEVKS